MDLRKQLALCALLAGFALSVPRSAVPVAHAATFTVCKEGCPYTTIQTAINAARSGDTIKIGPGVYSEHLVIDPRDTVTLRELQINGPVSMIGIFNRGILNLEHVKISNNNGGIVNSGGTVQLTESQVRNNQSGGPGGGIYNANGTATVVASKVAFNTPNNCVGVHGC